jgi:hypothetical protein
LDVPVLADAVALLGVTLILGGGLMVAGRVAWLAWQQWGWWAGFVYVGVGVAVFLVAAVGAWLYARGIPVVRARYHKWRRGRERAGQDEGN